MKQERRHTPQQSGFLPFIAYLQIIGIILVVLGHSFHMYPGGDHELMVNKLIYNFHMPLFVFISGFLMIYTLNSAKNGSPKGFVKFSVAKARRLLVPFFVLTLVTFFPRVWLSPMADKTIDFSIRNSADAFLFKSALVVPNFWFIQALFVLLVICYAVYYFCEIRAIPRILAHALLFALFIFLPMIDFYTDFFSIGDAVSIGSYFVVGGLYGEYHNTIDRHINWASVWVLLAVICGWLLLFFIDTGAVGRWMSSVFGIAVCISISKIFVKYNCSFLDHLIGANYIIFLLSWYFNVLAQQILSHYIVIPWWIHTIISLSLGIYVPWAFYRYMISHPDSLFCRFLAFILGQTTKKNTP